MNTLLTLNQRARQFTKYLILKLLTCCIVVIAHTSIVNGQCSFELTPKIDLTGYSVHKIFPQTDQGYCLVFTSFTNGSVIELGNRDSIYFNSVRFDSCRNILWSNSINLTQLNVEFINEVIQTPDSGMMLLGADFSWSNVTIIKTDKMGNLMWSKSYADSKYLYAYSFTYIPWEKSYIVAGEIAISLPDDKLFKRNHAFKIDSMGEVLLKKDIMLNEDSFAIGFFKVIASLTDSTILAIWHDNTYTQKNIVKLTSQLDTISITPIRLPDFDLISFNVSSVFDSNSNLLLGFANGYKGNSQLLRSLLIGINENGGVSIVKELSSNLPNQILFVSPSVDGGLVLGPSFLKLSPSFDLEWEKDFMDTIVLMDVKQLQDGSYVLFGIKPNNIPIENDTNFYMWPYIQKTNKQGWLVGEKEIVPAKNQLAVYPNPANETLTIKGGEGSVMRLVNIAGHTVLKEELVGDKVNIANVPDGFYLLYLQTQEGAYLSYKLTIQH